MNFWETVRLSLAALWAHKLRTLLTLLGVIIGVTAVIAVVSFVDGLNAYVAERIFNLGADVFLVGKSPAVITDMDTWLEAQKRRDLTLDDYRAVAEACTDCRWVGATLGRGGEVVYANNSIRDTGVRGWTHTMPKIYDMDIEFGRQFSPAEEERSVPVVVIGWDIYENLLLGLDPLGRQVRVDGAVFEVIGVAKKRGSALGQSRDNFVLIPITTHMKRYGSRQSVRIWGKSNGEARLAAAMDQARLVLRARRHLAYEQEDDFALENNQSFLALWRDISSAFFMTIILISSIALVVGGIVIMNMMLVSVTERTHEIGIRKALGARRRDILWQFLIEASTIAFVGGALGILLGLGIAQWVSALTSLPAAVKGWSVVMGLGVATSVGLFFGVYPANRAARLDPVVALRME
ncbi:MAG: ABC transporter permease [Terriglobia bacterium]